MNYSNREMADIHYYYGLARGSSERAQTLFAEHFPQRRIPNPRTFAAIHRRLRENGSFSPFRRGIGRPARDDLDDIADQILQRVEIIECLGWNRWRSLVGSGIFASNIEWSDISKFFVG